MSAHDGSVNNVTVKNVTAREAMELAHAGSMLVDVRERWEWDASHAPQATHIAMGELGQRSEELPSSSPVLIICHSGARSLSAATALVDAGFSAVNVLGGMIAWEQAGGAVVPPTQGAPLA